MVARICQLYPMACGATIVAKFFTLMHKWNWPRPVMLKEHALPEFNLRVWNPAVSRDPHTCLLQLTSFRLTVVMPAI